MIKIVIIITGKFKAHELDTYLRNITETAQHTSLIVNNFSGDVYIQRSRNAALEYSIFMITKKKMKSFPNS